eukprot:3900359-Prymnesium_polylepis.1
MADGAVVVRWGGWRHCGSLPVIVDGPVLAADCEFVILMRTTAMLRRLYLRCNNVTDGAREALYWFCAS